jgi:hypothetical protein
MATYAAMGHATTGIAAIFAAAMEIPCALRGEPQQVVVGASAVVDFLGEIGLGVDEVAYVATPSDVPTEVIPTVYGLREQTLQVSVWSPSQKLEESARVYASRLRTRLRFPSVLAQLRALGVGIVRIADVVTLDVEQSSRLRSGAALDVTISYGVVDADAPIEFIEEAQVTSFDELGAGQITSAGGDVLGDSLQIDSLPEEP